LISGDTVNGLTDQGFSEISRNLFLILNELDTIKVTISSFIDTITNGSIGKSLYSVEKKTRFLTQDTKNKVTSWITELRKVKEAALSIIPEDPKIKKDIDLLLGDLNQLEKELEQLQQELASISFEIPEKGTVGQILKDSNPFLKKIDSLKVNIDLLIEEIKKKGLALNIDIF